MPKTVSIIVPCYNEQTTIRLLLDAVASQTYPIHLMEIIIADGMSTDRTRDEIAVFADQSPELSVRVVDNPARHIPAALNRAIEAAAGEYVLRLDAHSIPAGDYVERSVAALEDGKGDNAGGVWEIVPGADTWAARSIAAAAAHPLGVGDAQYRHTQKAQHVDTVPFGAFRRALFDEIGMFDESLLTNEDYELNARIRRNGGRIWLDPAIRSKYFARSTFGDLARQYRRYGRWKAAMLRRFPETLRWRQLLPPLFVAGLAGGGILSLFFPWARLATAAVIGSYLLILLAAGTLSALKKSDPGLIPGVPIAIAIMHLYWGAALLWNLLRRT